MEMDDEQRREERLRIIEEKIRQSMMGRPNEDDNDHVFGEDENSQILEGISRRRQIERLESQENAREAAKAERERLQELREEERNAKMDEEYNEEMNYLDDQDEVVSAFHEHFPSLAEELEKNPALREKMNIALDLKIVEVGKGNTYWPCYREVAKEFVERLDKTKDNPDLAGKLYQREDELAKIAHKNLKQIDRDNVYANASFRQDGPAKPGAIQQTFAYDYDDVVEDPKAYKDAVAVVDDILHEEGEEACNLYPTYQKAGDVARTRNALREMAKSRGQDEDTI